jgi:very-short-patch-repair endonuclease
MKSYFNEHPKAQFWSKKNSLLPENVARYSRKKFIFDCPCGHEFEICPHDITSSNSWCSYCSSPAKKLCNKELNCNQCFEKSFASVIKSKYWSNKNILTPREVFKNSAKMYCFNCDKCENEFEIRASHVTSGVWCSKCRYKTEEKFYSIIKKIFPTINSQVKFEWCKKIKHLIFDFVIEERKLIIEVDGIQHFEQVSSWKSPEHNKKNDLIKMKCANDNGYSMILQDDIFFDRYDWLKEIIKNIEIISIDRVQNLYMCKKDEYKDFMLSKI